MRRNHQQQNETMMHKNVVRLLWMSLLHLVCCCCVFFCFSFSSPFNRWLQTQWMSITDKVKYVLRGTVKCVKLRDKRAKDRNGNRLIYYANDNKTTCTGSYFAIAQKKQQQQQWHAVVVTILFFSSSLLLTFIYLMHLIAWFWLF